METFEVKLAPKPAERTPEEVAAGWRKARKIMRTREAKIELTEMIEKIAAEGNQPWYGQGIFVNHLMPGLFMPVTLCGKMTDCAVSSTMFVTPIGIVCPTCVRAWNRAVANASAN